MPSERLPFVHYERVLLDFGHAPIHTRHGQGLVCVLPTYKGWNMRVVARYPAATAILTAFAVGIAGCDGGESRLARNGAHDNPTRARSEPLGVTWKWMRAMVIEGARRDFEVAVEGPRGFASCFISRFTRRLTQERVAELAAVHATRGEPAAGRALNGLGVRDGDACGGRHWVPQLTEAATGLRSERGQG